MNCLVFTFQNELKSARASCLLDERGVENFRQFSKIWIERDSRTDQEQVQAISSIINELTQVVVTLETPDDQCVQENQEELQPGRDLESGSSNMADTN
jgi:hypothetical protein